MLPRALARAGLASLVTLAACNSITGVNDLTFDGQGAAGAGGGGEEGGAGGAGGAAGVSSGGSAGSCDGLSPVSACYLCCETLKEAREVFLATAPKACGCPEKCEQDCNNGDGCDGATYKAPGCRACVAQACASPCGGSPLCQPYVACIESCGPPGGSNHGSCSQLSNPMNCRSCCLGAHPKGFADLNDAPSLKSCACGRAQAGCTACGTTCQPETKGTDAGCASCINQTTCPGICPVGSACNDLLTCLQGCSK